ncbi:hypothetical protein PMIN06_012723 [Paraphaeosphaeria minitans]|uniref:Ran binding protein in the microtubule-organising centre n=1 Tax=Paraphaeosphaeria minitans TaxID=565426 RepID=A0A9P6KVA7_9PLEO|nr:ran binding protein in the microtubule-organising centre [Paraphaeosphaeria minitans]
MSSSTVSASVPTPTQQHPFQRKIDEIKPSKPSIDLLVMDYLVSHGYPRTAAKFAKEAGVPTHLIEQESIEARVEIRQAIHKGDIDTAINKINDFDPQILDKDPALHFALLRLQLIELIRNCTSVPDSDITPAINFASSQLAPRAATNESFLKDLELTMTLLIFLPSDNLQPRLAELLKPGLRQQVAAKVNEAILLSTGARGEAKIYSLYRARQWSEIRAREAGKDLPASLPLGLEPSSVQANGNGESGDVMVQ